MSAADKYESFVEHPRFGKGPRITGLNPRRDDESVFLWHSSRESRIPNTAITASPGLGNSYGHEITHYFDLKRICRKCGQPFIFFAVEQKYWYERLKLPIPANCVCCFPCRRHAREIVRLQKRYSELIRSTSRTEKEELDLADCCLSLVEEGVFNCRQLQTVRMVLNRYRKALARTSRFKKLTAKVRRLS